MEPSFQKKNLRKEKKKNLANCWWEACTGEGITNSFGSFFSEAEVDLLPDRLFKCVRTTESLADFVKKKGRR